MRRDACRFDSTGPRDWPSGDVGVVGRARECLETWGMPPSQGQLTPTESSQNRTHEWRAPALSGRIYCADSGSAALRRLRAGMIVEYDEGLRAAGLAATGVARVVQER